MKREILVRLDITGAMETFCDKCASANKCPWDGKRPFRLGSLFRTEECITAEDEAKKEVKP